LPFPGLKQPGGVAVDTDGAVYVTDFAEHRVLKLEPGAMSPIVLPFNGLNQPGDISLDARGNVYVLDELNFRVVELLIG
jgi:serine/threonine-protein kinase